MSTVFDPTAWLEKKRLEKKIEKKNGNEPIQNSVSSLLSGIMIPELKLKSIVEENLTPEGQILFKSFENFIQTLILEQLRKPEELLKLNPTRRQSLGRFLSELNGDPEPNDPQEALSRFVKIDRNVNEHEALKQFFKQNAFVQLAKALLLKSWSKNSNFQFLKSDLKDLTAGVEKGLRPYIHLQTSTCQLIQRNFYSWYKMSHESQNILWDLLEKIEHLDETKDWLLTLAIQLSASTTGERDRYHKSFYQNLWKAIHNNQLLPTRENYSSEIRYGFCPTLRDGSLLESSPEKVEWIGFEPLCFELLFCEIRYLWNAPKAPQLWIKGSGLEMSMEQQASMPLTNSGKQNVLQQMDAITCCEIALISEESSIRTQARTLAAQALRQQIDQHPILKKLKQPTTTRGMYQACQSLEKLRQGGILIWAREELLVEASGKPALQFILNQAKIMLIADFSALQCKSDQLTRDLPKVLYLLKKENSLELRKSHRPLMIKAYGSLRNANDVSTLFDRVFSLVQKPEQAFPAEPFHIHARVSPIDQREWEQHWFNPTDDQLVDRIEDLKRNATPLGQLAVVRAIHSTLDLNPVLTSQSSQNLSLFEIPSLRSDQGFYVWSESNKNGSEIFTAELSNLPEYMKNSHSLFWVAPIQKNWSAPFQMLLRSQFIRDWFNYSVERKKGAWILKDTDLKAVPIPQHISDFVQNPIDRLVLPNHEQKALQQIATEPGQAMKTLETLFELNPKLKAHAFVTASQVCNQMETHQSMLFSLISPDEQIIFPKLFHTVLTDNDMTSPAHHPFIKINSAIPATLAIHKVSLMQYPSPGILLITSKGLSQQLIIQENWLRERFFEMIIELQKEIAEPTWIEICQHIRLPKNPEQAQAMSQQILKSFADEKMKRKELNHLLGACLLSERVNQTKIGLLQ